MTKRLISLFLILALAFNLCACGSKTPTDQENPGAVSSAENSQPAETPKESDEPLLIAYSTIAYSIAVMTTFLKDNMETAVKNEGWEFVALAAEGDAALQAEQVQTLIDMEPDYLVLFPADGTLAVEWVKDAAAAGISVICVCGDVAEEGQASVECYVGADNYGLAHTIGEWVVEQFGADAGLKIVEIASVPAQYDIQQRVQGFADAIADTNYEILGTEWAYSSRSDAQGYMENFISTYGDEIDLLFGVDDDLTLGGVYAIEEAGLDIAVVSMTGQIEAIQAIRDGKMTMTVATPSTKTVDKLMECIKALEAGEEIDYYQYSGYDIVTAENADSIQGEF